MLWDLIENSLIQHTQIGHPSAESASARSLAMHAQNAARLLETRLQAMEENLDRLSLVVIATTEILKNRFNVSPDEIEARIQEIDLRDGKLDGRLRSPAIHCPSCSHLNSPRRRKCLYCGEVLETGSAPAVHEKS
jgi:hypothetical protein